MAETVLAKMAVEISANAANFTKQLQSTEGKLNSFTNNLKGIAGTIGLTFGIGAVSAFAFEVSKLAGEAEGVRAAFERLPESEALMSRLKDATAGTVSELELMKRTVQATNFGISLESLPKLLEFAAVRAQQTGQSIDYLVDSIVTGIGRKSPLILDNLGISAVALKEQMGGVALATAEIGDVSAAVGRIAEEELKKMGGFSENTATKVARLSASWENFKVTLGNVANSSGFLSKSLNILSNTLNAISGDELTTGLNQLKANLGQSSEILERFAAAGGKIDLSWQELLAQGFVQTESAAKKYEKILAEITKRQSDLAKTKIQIDPVTGLPTGGGTTWVPSMARQHIDSLESLQAKVKELNEQFSQTDITDQKRLQNIGAEIIAVNEQIKTLEELRKARKASEVVAPNTVDAYQAALASLNKELENTNVKDTERIRVLSAQIAGYQDAIAHVEALKKSFQDFDEIVLPVPDVSGLLNPIKEIQETAGALSFTTITDSMAQVTSRFEEGLRKMADTTKEFLPQIKQEFIDMGGPISSAIDGVSSALGEAIAGTGDFGKSIIKVVAGFAGQLGKILISTGVGMLAAKKLLTNPYTAIIAGAALVALSAAAGAAISKSHSSAFGGSGAGGNGGGRATSNVGVVSTVGGRPEDRIQFDATFEIAGTKLVAVVNNTNNRTQRTG